MLFDGHKTHLSEILNAWAAEHNTLLDVLPPHTSHLLQPLDQGFFRRLKVQYGLFPLIRGLSKVSGILERIWMAVQATTISPIVWNAWTHSGIRCIVTEGHCTGCALGAEHVSRDPALHPVAEGEASIFEGARGRGVVSAEFGVLNEDEMLIWEARQCPFCCAPLHG